MANISWLNDFRLFLFDFDGLLVNTEELHYLAYKKMMAARGIILTWNLARYCQSAHYTSQQLREDLFDEFPELKKQDSSWERLYAEKQTEMKTLLEHGAVHLMPGVDILLRQLQQEQIPQCVVTHSPEVLISLVRRQHPILNRIPYWITRDDYNHPKPHSECYEIAIKRHSQPGDLVIGFEDSPRGLTALLATAAKPLLITEIPYPEIPSFLSQGVQHFKSLKELVDNSL
jgi:beta-phosphoglucomutase